jgi:hypothetical protein
MLEKGKKKAKCRPTPRTVVQLIVSISPAFSRQAYGFRNFENYRQRVQVLCS